ncbi:DMT family transporter [Pararhodobacter aggregans]|uniref:EamA family transporter n=1 Tax=Pararhodobacter aggregans TaxID=404875 RepID=A0A2T7UTS4_9RHOB|nr:DMT family transporter [Pararhodobacter aggregans]PTX02951.1 drug/metabolite transporter (DMT)-like permease [Pararhodobacter aggregans]PVE48163.1 EamA family transporter [Pararhodobacter aggregans]
MSARQNTTLGVWLMIAVTFVFAMQDGISRHLAGEYNVFMVVMIRYWFFASFVIVLASRMAGGLKNAARSGATKMQIFRGALLSLEIFVAIMSFVLLGLVEAHAVFATYPLLIAALSGPVLGEKVGWRRWVAIGIGFVGVLVILEPGFGVFRPEALMSVLAAFMFALYGLLTRYVARYDSAAVSFFWTGVTGAVVTTAVGVWFWEPMSAGDWGWMGLLCITSASSHFLLIKAYEVAEANAIQPFAYLQLVFASVIGITIFGETLRPNVAVGAAIVVCAGLFTLWRARIAAQRG